MTSLKIYWKVLREAMMINRACIFSDRPNTSQIEEQKFLRLDLCTLKLTQKIQALVYFLYNFGYVIILRALTHAYWTRNLFYTQETKNSKVAISCSVIILNLLLCMSYQQPELQFIYKLSHDSCSENPYL